MGLFDKLAKASDNFFDELKQKAIDNTLAAAKENNKQSEVPKPYGTDTDDIMKRIEDGQKMIAEKMASYVGPKSKCPPKTPYVNVTTRTTEESFKRIKMGMDLIQLNARMGDPKNIVENAFNGKIKTKYYYGKSTNRLGNDAYDFEVTLEEGKITGWKDRRNRGTRDI